MKKVLMILLLLIAGMCPIMGQTPTVVNGGNVTILGKNMGWYLPKTSKTVFIKTPSPSGSFTLLIRNNNPTSTHSGNLGIYQCNVPQVSDLTQTNLPCNYAWVFNSLGQNSTAANTYTLRCTFSSASQGIGPLNYGSCTVDYVNATYLKVELPYEGTLTGTPDTFDAYGFFSASRAFNIVAGSGDGGIEHVIYADTMGTLGTKACIDMGGGYSRCYGLTWQGLVATGPTTITSAFSRYAVLDYMFCSNVTAAAATITVTDNGTARIAAVSVPANSTMTLIDSVASGMNFTTNIQLSTGTNNALYCSLRYFP